MKKIIEINIFAYNEKFKNNIVVKSENMLKLNDIYKNDDNIYFEVQKISYNVESGYYIITMVNIGRIKTLSGIKILSKMNRNLSLVDFPDEIEKILRQKTWC